MIVNPQSKKEIDLINQYIKVITELDPSNLTSRKEWGSLNFEPIEEVITDLISKTREIGNLPLTELPFAQLTQIRQAFHTISSILSRINSFSIEMPNPQNERQGITSEINSVYEQTAQVFINNLPYLYMRSGTFQSTIEKSQELVKDMTLKVNIALDESKNKLEEINSIVQATRDAAGKMGVAKYASIFGEASKKYHEHACPWLKWAIGIGFLTITAAVLAIYVIPADGAINSALIVQRLITKVVIISLLYFAAIWSAKIYKTQKHLAVINEHRQNALLTFETFVSAASDEQTKNAVLLEATHCIFSQTQSGYLSKESDEPQPNRIIEILKGLGPKTS
jgi:hypothetical protein